MAHDERAGEPRTRRGGPRPQARKWPHGQVKGFQSKASGKEPGHALASAAIANAVDDVAFPASRGAIIEQAGHRVIPMGDDRATTLGQIAERVEGADYPTAEQFVDAVNRAWDDVAPLAEPLPPEEAWAIQRERRSIERVRPGKPEGEP